MSPLRVMSYNIWVGGGERLPLIRDIIRAARPDAVALLEANSREETAALAEALGMTLVYGEGNTRYHVAWLTRLPILRSENHQRVVFQKTALEIEVEWDGAPLRLFAVHLKAKITGERQRAEEIAALLAITRQVGATPHALVGDFNAIAPGDTYAPEQSVSPTTALWAPVAYAAPRLALVPVLAAGYLDCYRALHPASPGYTCKTEGPSVRIDYLFASPPLASRLRACDIITAPPAAIASDHFPIWAEFA